MRTRLLNNLTNYLNNIAIQTKSSKTTYKDLLDRALGWIVKLGAIGINSSSYVALNINDKEKFIELFLALWEIGALTITLDKQSFKKDGKDLILQSNVQYLLTDSKLFEQFGFSYYSTVVNDYVYFVKIDELKVNKRRENLLCYNDHVMLFTSGTNGKKKGVVIAHDSMLNNALKVAKYTNISQIDKTLLTLPVTYCYAISQMLAHFSVGACVFLLSIKTPNEAINIMNLYDGITNYAATPYFYESLANKMKTNNIVLPNCFRFFMNAGGYLSHLIIQKVIEKFPNILFFNNYGQTEAGPRISYQKININNKLYLGVGKPLDGVDIIICNEYFEKISIGEIGEIYYCSEDQMVGYYGEEEFETSKYIPSGDLGYINKNGALIIVGRKDSMIKINGKKVYKNYIEDALMQLECVKSIKLKKKSHLQFGEYFDAHVIRDKSFSENDVKNIIMDFCKKYFDVNSRPKTIIIKDECMLSDNNKIFL